MKSSTVKNRTAKVGVAEFLAAAKPEFDMELVAGEAGVKKKIVLEAAISRPGLALSGFYKNFAWKRIQILGLAEYAYLSSLTANERTKRIKELFAAKIPCLVVARNKKVLPEIVDVANECGTPVIRTKVVTKDFIVGATIIMENLIAPRQNIQGTMVEIMGLGVLIEGKPGIGKSDTALSLIKNGAALVADDITAMRVDSAGSVIASAVGVTRYHMEIKGLGIIHVPSLYGVASVRGEKKLDLIVTLCDPSKVKASDLNMDYINRHREVLGVEIPNVLLGVLPGRNIGNIIEIAALDHKLRCLGHDAAKELDEKLMERMTVGRAVSE